MKTKLAIIMLGTLLCPVEILAQEGSPQGPPPVEETMTRRPQLLKGVQPLYPPEAWEKDIEGDVVLLLWVNEEGKVEAAEVVSTPGYGLETAALVAAKKMLFSPAEVGGRPVKVKIRYTFKFRKPEKGALALPPVCPPEGEREDRRPKGTLKGTVFQRGTGKPLAGAEVYLLDLDEAVLTDKDGRFSREVTPGGYAITVNVPGYYPFQTLERVEPGGWVAVKYYVEQKRHERYKTVVWGSKGKALVGRTTLADAEIYEIPGTMGDPIRVVMLMPGVTPSVTGFGYPIIRGVLPGDTRYEVDGVQVPMLYHLMFGNAVVNPRFTSGINFQPGGYSVEHGGYAGSLIMARGTPEPEERVTAADVSIIHSSLFHAQPLTDDFQAVTAARYGTLGLIIEGLASDAIFRYWDYQTKLYWRPRPKDRFHLLAFGAGNVVGEEEPDGSEDVLRLGFHRLVLSWKRIFSAGWFRVATEFGWEDFEPPEEEAPPEGEGRGEGPGEEREPPPEANYGYVALLAKSSLTLVRDLEFHAGFEVYRQDFGFEVPSDEVFSPDEGVTMGAYLEASFSPGSWTVVPGVRVDHYRYGISEGPRESSVDPRLAVGYELTEWLTAKGSAGVFQGPPRVTLVHGPIVIGPVPGMVGVGLDYGLSRSIQFAGGLEAKLPWRLEFNVQGYWNILHTALDFSLMETPLESDCDQDLCPEGPPTDGMVDEEEEDEEPPPQTDGRSYGLELMLRRRLGESVFGWITYSLSRSERDVDGRTLPFVFDQRHVLNAVVSWEVGRHWTIGATFHYHSGRPYTPEDVVSCPPVEGSYGPYYVTCTGEPFSNRLPGYWRIDARVQKREIFDTWYFDFYLDIVNVTFNWETVGYEVDASGNERPIKFPIFVPMIGLRGQF